VITAVAVNQIVQIKVCYMR